MVRRLEPPGLSRLGLGAALLVGCWAWGRGPGGALGWLGVVVVPVVAVRVGMASYRIRTGLERLVVGLALTVVTFGGLWVIYPVLGESAVRVFARCVGVLLLGAGAVGLGAWPAVAGGRGVVPAALGLMGLGFLDPVAPQAPPLLAALGLGLLALLVERVRTRAGGGGLGGWLRWIVAGAVSLGLALAVTRALPWAQPHVEQAVVQVLPNPEASTGADFADQARLGEFARLGLSRRVALRLWAPEARLLRARALNRFDGRAWTRGPVAQIPLRLADATLAEDVARTFAGLPGRTFVCADRATSAGVASGTAARVVLARSTGGGLFVPAAAGALHLGADGVTLDQMGVARAGGLGASEVYGYALTTGSRDSAALEDDLALPLDVDPRFGILAQGMREGAPSPQEYLRRVMRYLDRECVYSLEPGRFRSQQPVAEFLFEKRRGYCEYFASAAAVLLRLGGVPTRFVAGFRVSNANAVGDHFVVRDSDAHAWIDVFLPGEGWLEADPTPPAQFAAVHDRDRPGRLSEWLEGVRAGLSELGARVRAQGMGALGWIARRMLAHPVPLAAALSMVGAGFAFWRRSRRQPGRVVLRSEIQAAPGIPRGLLSLVNKIEREWRREGMARPASRALLDHLALLEARRGDDTPRCETERAVIETYYRARFGAVQPGPRDVAALAERLGTASTAARGPGERFAPGR